jgi:acyl-CoA synthetase (AMP-forming)/AMP-acid ligase II
VGEASERFQCTVKRTYGSTEAPTITTSFAGDPMGRARETDGRPVGDVELRLAPRTGELLVRGSELFVGYANAEQTHSAVRGGWFHTGDLATVTDGWLAITGRIKDIIIRGGENIAVNEVEAVLEAHPDIVQAVAVGEPDERLGERVAAFVVARAPFDLEDCRAWFAAKGVAKYKTPERIVHIAHVPTMAPGKPDRTALRRLLNERG